MKHIIMLMGRFDMDIEKEREREMYNYIYIHNVTENRIIIPSFWPFNMEMIINHWI